MLEDAGHEVVSEAVNGVEGVEKFRLYKPDVVTMDITMPVMDGIEAVREIIEIDPGAKVIMVTAAGQKTNMVEALKRGAADFIQKPFDSAVIINTMTKNQTQLIMVQKYIPKARFGDKRVMFLGDEVLDVCVQKLPSNDDFKFNEHCDSNIVKAELTPSEKEKFLPVAKELNSLGLPLVGLDVIDEKIIEINVTSPCYFIKEVNGHFNTNLEKKITEFILSKIYVKA